MVSYGDSVCPALQQQDPKWRTSKLVHHLVCLPGVLAYNEYLVQTLILGSIPYSVCIAQYR